MTGWSGGAANRTWKRDARSPDSGRINLIEDVRRILADWRKTHGWTPESTWDPYVGAYVDTTTEGKQDGRR